MRRNLNPGGSYGDGKTAQPGVTAQRPQLSRAVLAHTSRQLRSWLICDVRQTNPKLLLNHMPNYFLMASVLALGRGFDLLSTWHITPTFHLELNQWMKRLGWLNTIFLNLALVLLLPLVLNRDSIVSLAVFSMLLAHRNYLCMPIAAALGEIEYAKQVRLYYQNTESSRFWSSVVIKASVFVLIGFFVLAVGAVDKVGQLWFVVGISRAFLMTGFFVAAIESFTRISARKVAIKARTNKPNQALVPTPASVTPAADAPVAPDAGAAHL